MSTNLNDFDYAQLDSLPKLQRQRCLAILHNDDKFRDLQTEQLLAQMGIGQVSNNPYEYSDFKAIAEQELIRNYTSYKESDGRQQIFARAMLTQQFPLSSFECVFDGTISHYKTL